MSAKGKVLAALVGIGVPAVLLGVAIVFFSSNPLAVIATITAMIGGGTYLLSYQEHE
ncbi:MAG: hypothetical protein KGJ23_00940 [Euryarchaeota archaeon]|nr:hypothetical protein [Euryarchaeota archaeon]MDE1835162.1 hypothetical protein [Euryarchaeota archaeon]MDE1880427.1 hypothetical protein [Euryarchaeota archaeon]MDE2045704.1 hypothetical protein [Thermoplasmata archaeon]